MSEVPIFFFICMTIVSVVFIVNFFKTRHLERLALIKYGKTADVFYGKSASNKILKYGLLLFAMGGGTFVGAILSKAFKTNGPEFYFACIMVLGGISLIYYHQQMSKSDNRDEITEFEEKNFKDEDFMV